MPQGRSRVYVLKDGGLEVKTKTSRFTPESLKGQFAFMENWNLHKTPGQCKGMLSIVRHQNELRLSLVLKVFSRESVALLLVSKANDPRPFCNGIDDKWPGFFDVVPIDPSKTISRFVQQISGKAFKTRIPRSYEYPFRGSDSMSSTTPVFEDIMTVPHLASLPKVKLCAGSEEHLTWHRAFTRNQKTEWKKKTEKRSDHDLLQRE